MPNIQFDYRYRDVGNYKKFVSIIFANPENIEISDLEVLIKSKLIDETWFYAEEWELPEIFLDTCDFRYDPTWHEFESMELTNDQPNSKFSLNEFRELLMATQKKVFY